MSAGVGACGSRQAPAPGHSGGARRDQRGAVTAEAAMVVPLLVAVTLGLVWLVALAATQVRVVDGAREVARVSARGDDESTAVGAGRRVAPQGTDFGVTWSGDQVRVEAEAQVRGPGGLFRFLPTVSVHSTAVAVREPT